MKTSRSTFPSVVSILVLAGCTGESAGFASPTREAERASLVAEWSVPELVAEISSPAAENTPYIATDGLSLLFGSTRPGGMGSTDLWVARRASHDDPWGPAENLGAGINSVVIEVGPSLSPNGQHLFFSSSRPSSADEVGVCGGGSATPMLHCDNDLYVASRECSADGCTWGAPVNLGPNVNTPLFEGGQSMRGSELYFNRGATANVVPGAPDPGPPADIHRSRIFPAPAPGSGLAFAFAPSFPADELNAAGVVDQRPSLSIDGLEIYFTSARAGTPDIWVSRRTSPMAPWQPPQRVDAVSGSAQDLHPSISADGRALYFASNRSGNLEIYVSRRER